LPIGSLTLETKVFLAIWFLFKEFVEITVPGIVTAHEVLDSTFTFFVVFKKEKSLRKFTKVL
jgi:hypothetical protein